MRILIITGSFPPMKCGVGDYTSCLAEALAKEAVDVAVLTDIGACANASTKMYEIFPVVREWKFSAFFEIVKIIRHWKPDIVHIQYPTQGYGKSFFPFMLPPLLFFFNVKIVQTWHEYYTKGTVDWILVPKFITPGGVVAVRPNFRERMPRRYHWLSKHKKFRFIPNASTIPAVRISDAERAEIHKRFTSSDKSLLVFFGFIYPQKGVEFLFEIADPTKHHIVFIGVINTADPYHKTILEKIEQGPWHNNVTVAGFLPDEETGKILAAADAVVLPFRNGGGMWNTSLHAAALQGTFVLTTSSENHGYVDSENIYYAWPGDVDDMRQALNLYVGRRKSDDSMRQFATWESIAKAHIDLYRVLLA
jgi:glycosyltransferase involved in cell wall biosynthesis